MKVPLSKPYMDEKIKEGVLEVLTKGEYILGERCKKFETEFANYIGTKHAILTNSGTSAIHLALLAMGIGKGDDVFVPSNTAYPTVEPVFHVGANPVFVDVSESYLMNPTDLEKKILASRNPKVILPVHLYGQPADMKELHEISQEHNLQILEDCCQGHGGTYCGKKVGSMEIAGCFSFYPSKNMTVGGDGGMVTTNEDVIAEKVRMLRNHGRKGRYEHKIVGFNLRFNEIQAVVGRRQLEFLDSFVEKRRQHAKTYTQNLQGLPIILPKEEENRLHTYHLYVIRVRKRDELKEFLAKKEIATEIHYPIPCHLQEGTIVMDPKYKEVNLPNCELFCKEILSLPMFPELKEEQLEYVVSAVREFYK